MLYLVPTPIGNLEDITYRSIRILEEVDYILSEDTRVTKRLLQHYGIDRPLYSFHAHNEHSKVSGIVNDLSAGMHIAVVSDAGTPGISDPGYLLVNACRANHLEYTCLPGPTAFVPALVMSGFPTDEFFFAGFLPHKKGRQKKWKTLSNTDATLVLYESTHRIIKCLEEIEFYFGENVEVVVARELTKIHEEVLSDFVGVLKTYLLENPIKQKGEFVVIINTKPQNQ